MSGTIDIDGTTLAYDEEGSGEALLLIHGGLGDRSMWRDQLPAFARRYRTIAPDLPGFGDSRVPAGPFSFHETLHSLLSALGTQQAHVLGLSLGGTIALDMAMTYPHLVRSLTLAGSGMRDWEWSPEAVQRLEEAGEAEEAGDIERAVELELQIWIDGLRRRPEDVDPEVRERVRAMNARVYAHAPEESDVRWPEGSVLERLGEIRAPALIVVGEEDLPDMHHIADRLAAGIPNARRATIPNAAHHPQMERPEEFNRIVLGFLESVS